MKNKTEEYLGALANAYLLLIVAALPLYLRDGYVMIGDGKYLFYLRSSLLFLALTAPVWAAALWGAVRSGKRMSWSVTDSFAAAFAGLSLLSWFFSSHRELALWGYNDWHMGLVTQLLLVWAYFLISRWHRTTAGSWAVVAFVCFWVCLLAVLNRFQSDPLGLFENMGLWDWNRNNLISTIGNINWFCGYLCTVMGAGFSFLLTGRGLWRVAGAVCAAVSLAALFLQGSAGGLAALGAVLWTGLFCSLRECRRRRGFISLCICIPAVWLILGGLVRSEISGVTVMEDWIMASLSWNGWWLVLLLLGAALLVSRLRERYGKYGFLHRERHMKKASWKQERHEKENFRKQECHEKENFRKQERHEKENFRKQEHHEKENFRKQERHEKENFRKQERHWKRAFPQGEHPVKKEPSQWGRAEKGFLAVSAALAVSGICLFVVCQFPGAKLPAVLQGLRIDSEWGNGRGALWSAAAEVFVNGSWKQKLLGAGPDCFAPAVYEQIDLFSRMHVTGQWQGSVFANAHNEWLNMLVCMGAPGALCYLGIFVSSYYRSAAFSLPHGNLLLSAGMMCIAGYLVNNLFSFQQVTAAPLVFVILGMNESILREQKEGNHGKAGEKSPAEGEL